ncbi:hypothetical protein [Synechocystis sp. LKSZ1]|uniref:slr1659 superfamily regulator n=1 Tax=Synechocystis sp. LKSZ1 TaxID=3144951 RepID=UPI00336BC2A0
MEHITEISTPDYCVRYEPETATIFCQGFLRLEGMAEYKPLMEMMLQAVETSPSLTLNLESLEFLNSSGISMLSMLVVKIREKGNIQLTLQGSKNILWQTKSLRNLQRLMPQLNLVLL